MLGRGGQWWELGAWEREVRRRWAGDYERAREERSSETGGASGREALWRLRLEEVANAGDSPGLARAR